MQKRTSTFLAILAVALFAGNAWAGFINPITEQISYQGRLDQDGQPFSGTVPMVFRVWPEESGGISTPLEIALNVEVADGLFQVELDFGNAFGGEAKWLEVEVNGQVLSPRQPIRAVPLALHALSTDVPPFAGWRLDGNAGTNPETNFVGTADEQPMVIRTANAQSLRIEPGAVLSQGLPITSNIIAGARGNLAWPGVRGATIGGGGTSGGDPNHGGASINRVTDNYGTVGGGSNNQAGNAAGTSSDRPFATVAGGQSNSATGVASTVGGGNQNSATGEYSTVAGGDVNVAMAASSVVSGGLLNRARSEGSAIAGGGFNVADGSFAFVSGGAANCAGGDYSWAGGQRAKVRPGTNPPEGGACLGLTYPGGAGDQGTFVWADTQSSNFVSSGSDQFLVRAQGGMGIGTNAPETQLHVRTTIDAPGVTTEFNPTLLVENDNPVDFFTHGLYARVSGGLGYAVSARATAASGSTRAIDASVSSPGGRAIHASSPAGGYAAFFQGGRVYSQGNVGIGIVNPVFQLHLSQNSAAKPTSNTWTVSSDERLKTDIETLDDALNRLLALRGVSFRWRDPAAMGGHDERYAGLLAQNVEAVFPEWVGVDPQGYKTVTVTGFEGLVAEALRELRAEKDAEIAALRSEHETHLAALQAELAVFRPQSAQMREMAERNIELERRLLALEAVLLAAGSELAGPPK